MQYSSSCKSAGELLKITDTAQSDRDEWRGIRMAALIGKGEAAVGGNRLELAQTAYSQAMADARALRNKGALLRSLRGFAAVAQRRGDLENAREALALLRQMLPPAETKGTGAGGADPVAATASASGASGAESGKPTGSDAEEKSSAGASASAAQSDEQPDRDAKTSGKAKAKAKGEADAAAADPTTSSSTASSSSPGQARGAGGKADAPKATALTLLQRARSACPPEDLAAGQSLVRQLLEGSVSAGGVGEQMKGFKQLSSLLDRALQGDASSRRRAVLGEEPRLKLGVLHALSLCSSAETQTVGFGTPAAGEQPAVGLARRVVAAARGAGLVGPGVPAAASGAGAGDAAGADEGKGKGASSTALAGGAAHLAAELLEDKDALGCTPLYLSVARGKRAFAEALLRLGASIEEAAVPKGAATTPGSGGSGDELKLPPMDAGVVAAVKAWQSSGMVGPLRL